jgi:adenosylhomocysteine nucleosidase
MLDEPPDPGPLPVTTRRGILNQPSMRYHLSQPADRRGPVTPSPGLVVALREEALALMGKGRWQPIRGPGDCHFRFRKESGWLCVHSGPGVENARAAAQWLVEEGVGALVAAGIAGGLHPAMKTGDLVIPDLIFQKHGEKHCPLLWEARCRFAALAYEALTSERKSVHRGPIVTTNQAVLTVENKRALYKRTLALVVDMESAPIARVATEAGLPSFFLRVVCDPVHRTIPRDAFDSIDHRGRIRSFTLLQRLLHRPSLLGDLLTLRQDFVVALASLGHGWKILMNRHPPDLLFSPEESNSRSADLFGVHPFPKGR